MERKYYVYGFFITKYDKLFYIGKGSGNRFLSISGRSTSFKNIIENNEYYSKILYNNLTEKESYDLEKELINKYGGLINIKDNKKIISKRICTKCNRDDVEFNSNISNRRCKSCQSEILRIKKIKTLEQDNIKMEKIDCKILDLYNLIYDKRG